jgi:nitrate/TMAO reductase-like tetraheme cytochrome c subunit
LNCFDCHNAPTPLTTRTVAAHGNAVTIPGVLTVTGTAPSATNDVTFCKVCHAGYVTGSNTHAAGSALSSGTQANMTDYLNYACNICHSSGYNTAVVRPIRAQDVHGVNALPVGGLTKINRWAGTSYGSPAQVNAKPYGFIRNTEILTEHNPLKIGGSTYTPGCTMGNGTPNCSRSFQNYTAGGTY